MYLASSYSYPAKKTVNLKPFCCKFFHNLVEEHFHCCYQICSMYVGDFLLAKQAVFLTVFMVFSQQLRPCLVNAELEVFITIIEQ